MHRCKTEDQTIGCREPSSGTQSNDWARLLPQSMVHQCPVDWLGNDSSLLSHNLSDRRPSHLAYWISMDTEEPEWPVNVCLMEHGLTFKKMSFRDRTTFIDQLTAKVGPVVDVRVGSDGQLLVTAVSHQQQTLITNQQVVAGKYIKSNLSTVWKPYFGSIIFTLFFCRLWMVSKKFLKRAFF